jgi:membrane-associated PAP2 superfamily phosphatase
MNANSHSEKTTENSRQAVPVARFRRRGWLLLAGISLVFVLVSWLFVRADLDRLITQQFYSAEHGWYLRHAVPWSWLYKFGTVPGLLLAIASLAGWFFCIVKSKWEWHRYFLVIVLTAVIGPGLLVNGIVKNYWGRPRPRQIQEFGGQWQYRQVYQPGVPWKGKSFPCGHCTMGYLFCTLLVFRRKNAWLAYLGATSGLAVGSRLGVTRVVQGAHFPTDAFGSLYIVLSVFAILYYFVFCIPDPRRAMARQFSATKKRWLGAALAAAAAVITIGFLLHRPFYESHRVQLQIKPELSQIIIETNADIEKIFTQFSGTTPARLDMEAWGFAWMEATHGLHSQMWYEKEQLHIELVVEKEGYFAELVHEINLFLPEDLEHSVNIELQSPAP